MRHLPADSGYPATLDVDYPDRPLNRLTTFFRVFTIIPIAIVLGDRLRRHADLLRAAPGRHATAIVVGAGGLLFAGPLLMILFRQKYPRWWFDWNLELTRFSSRVTRLRRAARRPLSVDRRAAVACTSTSATRTSRTTSTAGCRS